MPRLYDVFDVPNIKSVRATTKIHKSIDIGEVLSRVPKVKSITTSNKNVVRFEVKRGGYLLLFPTGYIEIHAADEGGVREVLVAFRDELSKSGLI
ncbi:MAG: hypothetical protein ABH852_00575 [Methanobacteriota archaeon]